MTVVLNSIGFWYFMDDIYGSLDSQMSRSGLQFSFADQWTVLCFFLISNNITDIGTNQGIITLSNQIKRDMMQSKRKKKR